MFMLLENQSKEHLNWSPEAVIETDLEGRVLCVSSQALSLFGYRSREQFKRKNIFDLVLEVDQQWIKKELALKRILKDIDCIFLKKNTSKTKGKLSVSKGPFKAFLFILRKDSKETGSEERYKELVNALPHIVFEADKKGKFTFMNEWAVKVSSYTQNEVFSKGMGIFDVIPPQAKKEIRAIWQSVLKGDSIIGKEIVVVRKDKILFPVLVSMVPMLKGQEIIGGRGVVVNIVKRKKMEEDLKIKDYAINSSLNAIVMADLKGCINYVNPAFLKLWQYKKKEVIGQHYKEFWKCDFKEVGTVIKKMKQGQGWTGEVKARRKDGTIFDVAASSTIVKGEDNNMLCMLGSFSDITERKKIEHSKNEFISLASHQLRTPLSTINWYSEVILDGDLGILNKRQQQYLSKIYQSSRRLSKLVNSILNVSRVDLGVFSINPIKLDLFKVAKGVVSELDPIIKKKQLKVTMKKEKDFPLVAADFNLMRIIFQNLFDNAIKYTPKRGLISIRLSKKTDDILIKVRDNGVGVPALEKDKIFGKLFRATNVFNKEVDGNGLGLYIVKEIVEQSGGKVWLESKKDNTIFYVSFPLKGMEKRQAKKQLI